MAPLVALKLAAPLTVRAVLAAWVMLPAALMARAPLLTATLPRLRALLLARAALPAALVVRVTVPLKALAALVRLMASVAAVKLAAPPTARAVLAGWLRLAALVALKALVPVATLRAVLAAWVMLPAALTDRLPLVRVTLPRLRALLLRKLTSAAALVMRVTAPVKALALPRLMAPLAALTE